MFVMKQGIMDAGVGMFIKGSMDLHMIFEVWGNGFRRGFLCFAERTSR